MTDNEIQRLIDHLAHKPSYIETHISYVLLLDTVAYKIKKTIQLPFLDFSAVSSRKFYCEEELRLNKRLAEDVYIAVVPVREVQGQIILEGTDGSIIDYAVKMKRLDTTLEMDQLLSGKKVKKEHIEKLAYKIADFHANAPVIKEKLSLSHLKADFNEINTQVAFIEEQLGQSYAQTIADAVQLSDQWLASHIDRVQKRSDEGLVRDVHGDLHSKNIFLYDGPVIFDCIEFSSGFRQIDLLNEIAFFCMDLEARDAAALSQHFYEQYINIISRKGITHIEDEALFLYFKLYRANVRAKVMSISAQEKKLLPSFEDQLQEIAVYINLIEQYTSALRKHKR